MFRTLFARLAGALVAVGAVLSLALVGVLQSSHHAFHLELEQKQQRDLAARLVSAAQASDSSLEGIFEQIRSLAVLNPIIAGYAVEADGSISASSRPVAELKRRRVATVPILEFVRGQAAWPLLGEDPAAADSKVIFSAAPLNTGTRYLYVVVGNADESQPLNQGADRPYALREAVWLTLANVAAALVAALVVIAAIIRPVRRLRGAMEAFDASKPSGSARYRAGKGRTARGEIDRLGEIFDSMADRIAAQMDALRRADEGRRELYASISHDLQTPLTSLHGYVQTLLMKNDALPPAQRRRYLEILERQTQQLRELIDQITDLARLETPEPRLQQERIEIERLLQQIAEDLRPLIEDKALGLTWDGPKSPITLRGDRGLLRRALANIVINAIQAAPRETQVRIHILLDGGNAVISIMDKGPGLQAGETERILEPYYRGARPGGPGSPGLGLGLAIAHKVIALHRGSLFASNLPEGGALVRVTLPLPTNGD